MARRARNYAAEYASRMARGLRRGLSPAAARGHRPGRDRRTYHYDPRLEEGLKLVREGRGVSASALTIGVAPERLRAYLIGSGVAEKDPSGRWRIRKDPRRREVVTFSRGRIVEVVLPDYAEAQLWGAYMSAVGQLLSGLDPNAVLAFAGQGVTDVSGHFWPFETDRNTLIRLNLAGPAPFELIYRIVV